MPFTFSKIAKTRNQFFNFIYETPCIKLPPVRKFDICESILFVEKSRSQSRVRLSVLGKHISESTLLKFNVGFNGPRRLHQNITHNYASDAIRYSTYLRSREGPVADGADVAVKIRRSSQLNCHVIDGVVLRPCGSFRFRVVLQVRVPLLAPLRVVLYVSFS